MTIQAQLADGRVLEFPDGTDPNVIQATVKKMLAPERIEAASGLEPDFPCAAIIEPLRTVGSAIAQTAGGGLAGIAQALTPGAAEGAGAETVRGAQEKIFQPTTQAGQEGLETLGQLVEAGVDLACWERYVLVPHDSRFVAGNDATRWSTASALPRWRRIQRPNAP